MREGFQLNPFEIAEEIRKAVPQDGAHLMTYFDSYARPDFETGMTIVHEPVDRAVLVFVGSREQVGKVASAARATA